jgi:hypothetical protein
MPLCENVLGKAIALGMETILKLPDISFVLQGEDTDKASNELKKDTETAVVPTKPLGFEHRRPCFKPAWDKAFGCMMRNRRGWELEGTYHPF